MAEPAFRDERLWEQIRMATAFVEQRRANCARYGLTPRETDVAMLLAERLSCREIADRLGMGFTTARTHTDRVLTKLNLRSKKDVSERLSGGARLELVA
jgi:DNA-binding CsgD family transcriptional regulator